MNAGIYQHYKGGYYQVLGVAEHSETGEHMVVYISLDATQPGPRMRVRPQQGEAGFFTLVKVDKPSEGSRLVERFTYLGDWVQE